MIASHSVVALRAVEEVDLESRDRRPSGAADHDRDTLDLELARTSST